MTNKEIIAKKAFSLFAEQGYDAISTKAISAAANVSEGLIFRHYGNKEGLLKAVILSVNEDIAAACPNSDMAKQDLQTIMELPFKAEPDLLGKLKFSYTLAWEGKLDLNETFAPFKERLLNCLSDIGATQTELEAELILSYVHGFATAVLLDPEYRHDLLLDHLRTKYTA